MWPWGHLAVAYLLYHAARRLRGHRVTLLPLLLLALGTQLPDLIDKPLAWHLALLPSGRSAAHSLLALPLVLGAAHLVLDRRDAVAAFALGYVSHLALDALDLLLSPDAAITDAAFLLYPLLTVPPDDPSFVSSPLPDPANPSVWIQLGLLAAATLLYLRSRRR